MKTQYSPKKSSRKLTVETLEPREMLSVSTADFEAIKSQYADLNLGNYADYNPIEITELSDANLRAAITTAGNTEKSDLIVVRTTDTENTINLTATLEIDINFDSFGSVNIVSLGTKPLTLSDDGVLIEHSDYEDGTTIAVGLAGLTITGAYGGLRSFGDGNNVIVTKCTITDNFDIEEAAGINQYLGTMYISHSTISNNFSGDENNSYGYGPMGYGSGISTADGNMTINNCIITGNTALSEGGGIANYGSTLTIKDSTISGNSAGSENFAGNGGGIYNDDGALTITDCVITDNRAEFF